MSFEKNTDDYSSRRHPNMPMSNVAGKKEGAVTSSNVSHGGGTEILIRNIDTLIDDASLDMRGFEAQFAAVGGGNGDDEKKNRDILKSALP
jgi:hypothetical protein